MCKKALGARMSWGTDYLLKAAECSARSERETNPEKRTELENLARAYLRLAVQAKYNAQIEIIYEPALPKLEDPETKE
jgi:hypothetical protein